MFINPATPYNLDIWSRLISSHNLSSGLSPIVLPDHPRRFPAPLFFPPRLASKESIFSISPTLSPASAATSVSTAARELVELSAPVGEDAVLLAEVEEVTKVVGRAAEDWTGRVHSPQMLERVTLGWAEVEAEVEMED